MADKNLSSSIPDGWEVKTENQNDGTEIPCYWCPQSGQHFFAYEDMMRYIKCATKYKLSIYPEDFQNINLRKRGNWSQEGNRTTITPRRRHFLGESSKTLPSYRVAVTSAKESSDSEENTTLFNPEDSTEFTDTGKNMEAGLAGIDKEPQILSSDLEALDNGTSDFSTIV